ncbi:MAG: CBS domain-containing protein, partial [bacterium]|nr:CBS domain-containing protein [bacterium]
KSSEYSPLEYLVVKPRTGKIDKLYIPYSYVENFNTKEISLSGTLSKINTSLIGKEDEWVPLNRDVMDEQIVDVSGARVVRVNDLRLKVFQDKMSVVGIDVSFKGLLRRLGWEWIDFADLLKVNLIDWRHSQPVRGILKLDTAADNLRRLHPADLANILEDLNLRYSSNIVSSLDARSAAKVFEEVDPRLQKNMVKFLDPEKAAVILGQMSADEVVDLVKMMPKEEAKVLLSYLQNTKAKKVEKLIKYEDDTAGGLMNLDFIRVRQEMTVGEAIEEIKKTSPTMRSILYIYVLDENDKFLGAISLRWVLVSDSATKLKTLLKKYPNASLLHVDQDVEEVMNVMTKYNLYSAVVSDHKNRMLGVVTIDDVMRRLVPKA